MSAPIRTFLEADVNCYHCGQTSGVVRSDGVTGTPSITFKPHGSDAETPIRRGERIKCVRCQGPTFFDAFEQRVEYARVDFLEDRPRRGRPPKRLVEQRGAA